jgi:hypothetical protein
MKNSELVVELFQTRPGDAVKLFTRDEIEVLTQKLENSTTQTDKEVLCGQIIDLWNQRVLQYNQYAERWNQSIYDGTHPALGKGIVSDIREVGSQMWNDFTSMFK